MDYKAFFLDDGAIAGRAQAVQLCLDTLERLLLEIGLEIARNKTEVIPACSAVQNFTPHDFEAFCWVPDGNFKLLGVLSVPRNGAKLFSIGRVTKARTLLEAIGRYHDSPLGFCPLGMGQHLILMQDRAPVAPSCGPLQR